MKMLSAYYVYCIYLTTLQNNFIMDANTINPDQTATKSGFILLAKLLADSICCDWWEKGAKIVGCSDCD